MTSKARARELLGPRLPGTQLSPLYRGAILGLRASGVNNITTARVLNIPPPTTRKFMKRATNYNDTAVKQRPGGPRVTSTRTDRLLVRETKRNRRQPLSELNANVTNNGVSKRTLQRRLSDANIRNACCTATQVAPGARTPETDMGTQS
ncbi:hypothetical protein ABW20_dc0102980 [Dactylellina cionopaga]|nr:hypothetical protein ABW20_dc0102980 [Dactylellina cionopaga]